MVLGRILLFLALALISSRALFAQEACHGIFSQPVVIVVDGYSSGRYLAPAFTDEGVRVVHVHSKGRPLKANYVRTFLPETYDLDLKGDVSRDELIAQIKQFSQVLAVLPGADSGVSFADELGTQLREFYPDLIANTVNPAHKDKFEANEALSRAGIDFALQKSTSSFADAIQWVQQNHLLENGSRVVVKPRQSASLEKVFFCSTPAEIEKAMSLIVNSEDEHGNYNAEALIQEFIAGTEYAIQVVSRDGIHKFTDAVQYMRRKNPSALGADIYDFDFTLPFEGLVQERLAPYVLKVLDAIDHRNGPSHIEVKITPEGRIVMMEANLRMMGSGQPKLIEAAQGNSQIDRTIMAVLRPDAFKALPQGYLQRKQAAVVTVANPYRGGRLAAGAQRLAEAIPGYLSGTFNRKGGQFLSQTIDLNTQTADFFFVADTFQQLMQAIDQVHRYEKSGFFLAH